MQVPDRETHENLAVPAEERAQLDRVMTLLRDVLGEALVGAYLFGSAVTSGLQPRSDLDVMAVVSRRTSTTQRAQLITQLLEISGHPRYLEVTVVSQSDVRPWRYPPRMELQYGDWWRNEFEHGELQPWDEMNPDLASLITMVLDAGTVLYGPPPDEVLDRASRRLQKGVATGHRRIDGRPSVRHEQRCPDSGADLERTCYRRARVIETYTRRRSSLRSSAFPGTMSSSKSVTMTTSAVKPFALRNVVTRMTLGASSGSVAVSCSCASSSSTAASGGDEVMAHEAAVDRGTRGRLVELPAQLVQDGARTPTGMAAAQLHDASFDLGRDLVWTALGLGALVGERRQAVCRVAHQPTMKSAAIDSIAGGGVFDGGPVEHLPHGVVALLNHGQIHQWHGVLLGSVEHK